MSVSTVVLPSCFSLRYWEEELRRKERGRKARLWVAICRCFWWRVLIQGVLMFLEVTSLVPGPFLEGEMAWQFPRVQTVSSAARDLEDPIRFQIAVT